MDERWMDLRALNEYVAEHTRRVSRSFEAFAPEGLIDVHFFKVAIYEDFDKDKFRTLFNAFLDNGYGEFGDVSRQQVMEGPSYIAWGGWIGDQGMAMHVMAAGQYAGLWTVITPESLGVEGDQAEQLAGSGYVFTAGLNQQEEVHASNEMAQGSGDPDRADASVDGPMERADVGPGQHPGSGVGAQAGSD